jgi:basic membrane lipoprotein Med (substrate-binding protein (PBP1-ABC) superfamily)
VLVVGVAAGVGIAPTVMPPTTGPGGAVTVTATMTAQEKSAIGKLKVGLILPITREDYSWNYQAQYSAELLRDQFGFELTVAENLFDGTKAEPIATDWASRGYNVIIGQGIQYQDMFIKIAPQFQDTVFVCVDCFSGTQNVYNVWWYMADGGWLMGLLAGKISKTGKLGLIGGGRVPSIWGAHEAFKRGAKSINPNVQFLETWMPFSWADVAGAKRSAEQMIDQGVDFLFSSGDGVDVGVRQAAKERNVQMTGVYADATRLDPDHIAQNVVVRWDIVYLTAMFDYVRNDYKNKWLQADVFSGIVSLGQFGNAVPQDVRTWLMEQQFNLRFGLSTPYAIDFSCFDKPEQPQCAP